MLKTTDEFVEEAKYDFKKFHDLLMDIAESCEDSRELGLLNKAIKKKPKQQEKYVWVVLGFQTKKHTKNSLEMRACCSTVCRQNGSSCLVPSFTVVRRMVALALFHRVQLQAECSLYM